MEKRRRMITRVNKGMLVMLLAAALIGTVVMTGRSVYAKETAKEEKSGPVADTEFGKETEWTVYLYMCGADLESDYELGSDNLKALMTSDYDENVRYVVQTGGSAEWHTDWIDDDKVQRFVIQGDSAELVEDYDLIPMNEAETLADFLTWGTENYPSEKSMAIMWDHGGGMTGAFCDGNYAGNLMSGEDIIRAFEKSGAHFDVIGFDACLMADFDMAYALSEYADYYVASEETIPGCGWDYAGFSSCLADNPTCSPEALCRDICDNYEQNLIDSGNLSTSTLSVVETSQMQGVRDAVSDLIDSFIEVSKDPKEYAALLRTLNATKHYCYPFQKDLTSFAKDAEPFVGRDVSLKVEDAVRRAVVYRTQVNEGDFNNGISFFWGFETSNTILNTYANVTTLDNYLALMDAYFYAWHAPSSIYDNVERLDEVDYDMFRVTVDAKLQKNMPVLNVNTGIDVATQITYGLYKQNDSGRMLKISEFGNLKPLSETSFMPEFDGLIPTIDGYPIVLNVDEETNDYVIYECPIFYDNGDGNHIPLKLKIEYIPSESARSDDSESHWIGSYANEADGQFVILGVVDEQSSSASQVPTRNMFALDDGANIIIAYPEMQGINSTVRNLEGPSFVYDKESTKVEMTKMEDGDFTLVFNVKDVADNTITSETFAMSVLDGKLMAAADDTADKSAQAGEFVTEDVVHIPSRSLVGKKTESNGEIGKNADGEDSADASDVQKDKITAFLYLDGSYENMGFGTQYIQSMLDIPESEDVNILIETGGVRQWKNDAVDGNYIQRFELTNNLLTEVYKKPICNMGSGYEFADFLKWGADNYPAEDYVLISYDHGGAWTGNTVDEIYDNSTMRLNDIVYALDESGLHFKDIIYNCCLMSCVEVASAMAPYADYMVAAEECILAVNYKECELLKYLIEHSDNFDGKEYGKFVVDSLMKDLEAAGITEQASYQAMSLIDLSKIDFLCEALNDYGRELSESIDDPEKITDIISHMENSRSYEYDFMHDVRDMVNHTPYVSRNTINKVLNANSEAVVYMRADYDHRRNGGLSVCLPLQLNSTLANWYMTTCPYKDYLAFMDAASIDWNLPDRFYDDAKRVDTVNPLDYELDYKFVPVGKDKCAVEFDDEDSFDKLISASYQVFRCDDEAGILIGIDYSGNLAVDIKNNRLTENFDGRIMTVDGAECYLEVDSEEEDRTVYSIPIIAEGITAKLKIAYYPSEEELENDNDEWAGDNYDYSGEFKVLGIQGDNLSTGIAELDVIPIGDGFEATLLIPEYDAAGSLTYWNSGETIMITKDTKLSMKSLEDDTYILKFILEDGLGNMHTSDPVPVTIYNGRVKTVDLSACEEENADSEDEEDANGGTDDDIEDAKGEEENADEKIDSADRADFMQLLKRLR